MVNLSIQYSLLPMVGVHISPQGLAHVFVLRLKTRLFCARQILHVIESEVQNTTKTTILNAWSSSSLLAAASSSAKAPSGSAGVVSWQCLWHFLPICKAYSRPPQDGRGLLPSKSARCSPPCCKSQSNLENKRALEKFLMKGFEIVSGITPQTTFKTRVPYNSR